VAVCNRPSADTEIGMPGPLLYDDVMALGYRHVGVIGAMAEEVERLHHHLDAEVVTEHAGRIYRHGLLAGQRVTVVQSRIGKVAATLTAAALIRDHDVDAIVFTGIAGALHDGLAIGDVVVATDLVQHDLAGPPKMFARSEIPLLGVVELPTDPTLTGAAVAAARAFVDDGLGAVVTPEQLAELGVGRPSVHTGQVATGDEFIEGELKEIVRRRSPRALCVDMEGAAVAQACHELGDVPLCVVRAISDLAGGTASVDFPRFLDQLASHYSYEILRRMCS
jgi:adenosylhomocysteine nucleosidase